MALAAPAAGSAEAVCTAASSSVPAPNANPSARVIRICGLLDSNFPKGRAVRLTKSANPTPSMKLAAAR
jgi:hypothetical protein